MKKVIIFKSSEEECEQKRKICLDSGLYTIIKTNNNNECICYVPRESFALDKCMIMKGTHLFYEDGYTVIVTSIDDNGICYLSDNTSYHLRDLCCKVRCSSWSSSNTVVNKIKNAFYINTIDLLYCTNERFRLNFISNVIACILCCILSPFIAKAICSLVSALSTYNVFMIYVCVFASFGIFIHSVKSDIKSIINN